MTELQRIYELICPEFLRVFGENGYSLDDNEASEKPMLCVDWYENGEQGECFSLIIGEEWIPAPIDVEWSASVKHPPLSAAQEEWLKWSASVARGNLVKSASKC